MALLDWLGLGGNEDPKKKAQGIDVMKAFGAAQDAANSQGAFAPGGAFGGPKTNGDTPTESADSIAAKKKLTSSFWDQLMK